MFKNSAAAPHMVSPSLVLSEALLTEQPWDPLPAGVGGFCVLVMKLLEALGDDYAVCICIGPLALSLFPSLAY